MYKNNLVVAVKHRGKVLRETGDCVSLPFSSEYSLLVKNLNSRKVSVNLSIDGDDVLDGKSLLIQPNSRAELKGFLKGKTAKNKFRFIEKTKQISKHRGDRVDDGLIRVEFAFEKEQPEVVWHYHEHHDYWPPPRRPCPWEPFGPIRYYSSPCFTSDDSTTSDSAMFSNSNDVKKSGIKRSSFSANNNIIGCCESEQSYDSFNEDGITVKGSEISQGFDYGYIGELEKSNVMIIRLRGEKSNGTIIEKPRLVKTRLVCPTCGKKSRSDLKFCGRCGTFLN